MRARPSFYDAEDAAYPGLQCRLSLARAAALLGRLERRTGEKMPALSLGYGKDFHSATAGRLRLLYGDLRPIVLIHEWAHMMQQREDPGAPHHGAVFATLVCLLAEVIK